MSLNANIAFFGGQPLGVPTLEALKQSHILPQLIICNPDRPAGRGKILTAPPVKEWAEENKIRTLQPESYKDTSALKPILEEDWDLFVVVAYNFILPKWLLDIPTHGVLNVHPSLLPKLRGASPIRSAIKDDLPEAVGVSIMQMDAQMDHGPVLVQHALEIAADDWPTPGPVLDERLATLGGELLAKSIPQWLENTLSPQEQDHAHATYCTRFTKQDAELALDPKNLPKGIVAKATLHHIYAFQGIGDSYFICNDKRVKIKEAKLTKDGALCLLRVVPEGKSAMDFEHYLQMLG